MKRPLFESGPHRQSGSFTANGAGSALSTASIFHAGTYPVVGRFSLAGGNPLATVGRNVFHAIGLKLTTPDGQEWRTTMDHTPIFLVADPQSFQHCRLPARPTPEPASPIRPG